jgi:phosphate transport system permease protein
LHTEKERFLRSASVKTDILFRWLTVLCALLVIFIVAGIVLQLLLQSRLAISKFGAGFLVSRDWNPVAGQFGALSSIYGTVLSTLIAMLLAGPAGFIIALFLVELAPPRISRVVGIGIELLAAIPSIIYGMWGLFVFAPFMADYIQPALAKIAPGLPLFSGPPMGIGILSAGIILAIMILPFICAVCREVFTLVPAVVKEAAYGIGGTTWEVTRHVTTRYGLQGILGAMFLGLGRAAGETMAVTFVIGNNHSISSSLFSAGNSIASTLANEFTEASEPLYLSSLVTLGLVLMLMTFIFQIAAHLWLKKIRKKTGAGL